MLDLYSLSIIAFLIVLAVLIYYDRRNFNREGIVLLRRTSLGLKMFDTLAQRNPKFWRWYGNIAAGLAFPIIVSLVLLLAFFLMKFLITGQPQEAFEIVLPIPLQTAVDEAGFIGVPFWHWIIAIIIISVIHEFSHGILARLEGVPVKSTGFGFLGPIMAAFVETDDKRMFKKGWKAVARIAAVGPFTNIVFAGLILVAGTAAYNFSPQDFVGDQVVQVGGIYFNSTTPGFPASEAGLINGTIVAVNGNRIERESEFYNIIPKSPGETAVFTILTFENGNVTQKDYELNFVSDPENPERGVIGLQELYLTGLRFNPTLLAWIFLLNLGLGMANLLPIGPLDGGHIWREFAKAKLPHGERIAKYTSRFTAFVLLFLIITAIVQGLLN